MNPFDFDAGIAAARPTVVLLHSSASSSRQWSGLVEQLQPRFDVHAIDLHGHGEQPPWQGRRPLALADEAALVEPILHRAGSVHLVGHSYGGAVALKLAAMHPRAVASVAVYEPVLFRWLFDLEPHSEAAAEVRGVADSMRSSLHRRSFQAAAERFVDYWSGAGTWRQMPPARQAAIASRMPAVLAQFGALAGEPFALPAGRSWPPILFMSGTESPASARRIARIARTRLPGATFEVLPAMGHMGPLTHGPDVFRRIGRFLTEQAAGLGAARAAADDRPRIGQAGLPQFSPLPA